MRVTRGLLVIVAMLVAGGLAWSADEPTSFSERLRYELRAEGMGEEAIRAVLAVRTSWEGASPNQAGTAALAVMTALRTRERLSAQQQAEVAYQSAVAAGDMEGLGLKQNERTRAVLGGVREVMERTRTENQSGEALGDLLRVRLRTELRESEAQRTKDRLQTGVADQKGARADGPVSYGPQGGPERGHGRP